MPHISKVASPSRSKSPIQLDAGLGDQKPILRGFVKSEPDLGSPTQGGAGIAGGDSFHKRGKGRKRQDTEQTPQAEESLIGVRVLKKFGNVWYIGTVQSYKQECGMWRILYEDGDTEDLKRASVLDISISEVDAGNFESNRRHAPPPLPPENHKEGDDIRTASEDEGDDGTAMEAEAPPKAKRRGRARRALGSDREEGLNSQASVHKEGDDILTTGEDEGDDGTAMEAEAPPKAKRRGRARRALRSDREEGLNSQAPVQRKRTKAGQTSSLDKRSRIGQIVLKVFEPHGAYLGEVVRYTRQCGQWRVRYEDGDSEDLEDAEIDAIAISKQKSQKVRASRDAPPPDLESVVNMDSPPRSAEVGSRGRSRARQKQRRERPRKVNAVGAEAGQVNEASSRAEEGADEGAAAEAAKATLPCDRELCVATEMGRTEDVRRLLHVRAEVGRAGKKGYPPLHIAAKAGHLKIVQVLVDAGAPVSGSTVQGRMPLHLAARNGHLEVVRLLLKTGADVSAGDSSGYTPLHMAAEAGHLDVVLMLLESGASKDVTDAEGFAPLALAAGRGHLEVVEKLIDAKADIELKSKEGTPLHEAAKWGQVRLVRKLLEAGSNMNAVDSESRTPLHSAVARYRLDIARMLIDAGADKDSIDSSSNAPLHAVAATGCVEIAQLLLKTEANIEARNRAGYTPLHVASFHSKLEVATMLVKAGADKDSLDHECCTPLHVAAGMGHLEIARMLIEAGGNTDSRGKHGRTPLHVSALGAPHALEMIDLLVRGGADLSATDQDDKTPEDLALDTFANSGFCEGLRAARKTRSLAFAMGSHMSLGEASKVRSLPPRVIRKILESCHANNK